MACRDILKRICMENSKITSDETIKVLSKIAENILKDPSNIKFRTLPKNNITIANKILIVNGAVDCLKFMGFQENPTTFFMPLDTPLTNVHKCKDEITLQNRNQDLKEVASTDETMGLSHVDEIETMCTHIQKVNLPSFVYMYTNPFLRRMEKFYHDVLQYEDKNLQERARSLIPLRMCEEKAQVRLRSVQELVKKKKLEDLEISIQDMLIIELLKWFKEEFFSWVNSPECINCRGETTFSHMSADPKDLVYTERVELHRCKICHQFTSFPRFTDLNILLETRRGRCGEWANTFTLFCRALSWDARFVVDEGDHVWTEVYSMTQKRWLHCDPCENICDSPLLYENGWHKEISYVIAYSADEIQDVTWRYTSNHKAVLKRRNKCSETELLNAIFQLRNVRQKHFSETKRNYLTKRLLNELVEFLTEKKPGDTEQKGRTSGSASWRLARGEIQNSSSGSPFIWQINGDELVNNEVILKYSSSLDKYKFMSGNKILIDLKGWNKGTLKHSGIFKKEEKDWNMVYLARTEGCDFGQISWKVELINSTKHIDSIILNFDYSTFENGLVNVEIGFDDKKTSLPNSPKIITVNDLHSSSLTISVSLSGGKGDVAWQHAQLFRQRNDSNDFPFSLKMTLK